LKIAEGKDRSVIKADVEALLKHFEQGGKKRNWFIFYPKVVKNAWYIVKDTYVDGRPCDNTDTLKKLLVLLRVDEHLDNIWREWSVYITRPVGSRGAQLHDLEDLCEPLSEAMKLYSQMAHAKEVCANIELEPPVWHTVKEVEFYIQVFEAVEAEKTFKISTDTIKRVQDILNEFIKKPDSHPIVTEMNKAIVNRNEAVYGRLYKEIEDLKNKKQFLARRKALYWRLCKSPAKSIAEEVAVDPYQSYWIERFSCFSESWRWAQACTWLKEYIDKLNEQDISLELDSVELRINSTVSLLAAEMAWGHCFARLKEPERNHLMAWSDATKRVGKGTGKNAEKNRRNAREHMEHCRSAIPAWIMPLYRVAETVEPGVDKYDVVIIDEASQSGPDALFLQFLAKQIVVVGDDKQISPLSIGTPIQEVDWLREQYIKDIPNKDALGPESSFFDLAGILFSGRIVLREHFRCMPEIIQFSNNQFYSATPLIPLRQYPPKCLDPVKTYHVTNGYRDGGTRTPRNLPEAEAIVAKIKECCDASEYDGKTMGVISLLGEYQARLIEDMLLKAIGPEEMAKRNIVCGDAYAFQGDERHVMFLSMVAAPPGPDGTSLVALATPEASRRFNVAASRAKDQMWLFHTPTINDFGNHECLRYRLLEYCQNYKKRLPGVDFEIQQLRIVANNKVNRAKFAKPGEPYSKYFDSWFEVDVFLRIVDKGYQVTPQFEVAKYSIDLMVQGSTKQLAIECYGDKWHSESEQRERDINRERILKRSGLIFWTVWGSEFYFNQPKALEPLWQKLDELGIAPGGKDKFVGDHTTTSENVTASKTDLEQISDNESIFVNQETLFPNKYPADDTKQISLWLKKLDQKETTTPDEHRHFSLEELQDAIVAVLKQCPNNSCTKKSLTTRVCRYLNVITRGKPRDKFEQKIMKALDELKNRYVVEEYTATNIRIRLVRDSW
jgi:very-short-patch-repair endonuclease